MKYTQILLITIATILLACSPTDETLLIENINGYTIIGDELVEFKSVAIKNGKFIETSNVSLGDEFPNAKVIDGNGKTLLPGLIDAHGHVMGLGFQQLNVNLMGINSLEATLDTLKIMRKQIRIWNGFKAGVGIRLCGKRINFQQQQTLIKSFQIAPFG